MHTNTRKSYARMLAYACVHVMHVHLQQVGVISAESSTMEYSIASRREPARTSSSHKVAAQQTVRARLRMGRYVHGSHFQSCSKVFVDRTLGAHPHTLTFLRALTHTYNRMFASGIMQKWHFVAQQNKVSPVAQFREPLFFLKAVGCILSSLSLLLAVLSLLLVSNLQVL